MEENMLILNIMMDTFQEENIIVLMAEITMLTMKMKINWKTYSE